MRQGRPGTLHSNESPGDAGPVDWSARRTGSVQLGVADLIGTLYDAAVDPRAWGRALAAIEDLLSAHWSILACYDFDTGHGTVDASGNDRLASEAPTLCQEHLTVDAWTDLHRWLVDDGAGDGRIVGRGEFSRSVFGAGLFRGHGIASAAFVAAPGAERRSWFLMLGRPAAAPDFDEFELTQLRRVAPHLRRAHSLWRRIQTAEESSGQVISSLNKLPCGVVLLGADGKILSANGAAQHLLRAGAGLADQHGYVLLSRPADQRIFLDLLARVAGDDREASSEIIVVPREPGHRPLSVILSPLSQGLRPPAAFMALAIMVLSDPDAAHPIDPTALCRLYDLTPTEARLAAELASGMRLEDVAERQRMNYQTARWHLKHIFLKTSTARQTELVRLLLTNIAHFRMLSAASGPPTR